MPFVFVGGLVPWLWEVPLEGLDWPDLLYFWKINLFLEELAKRNQATWNKRQHISVGTWPMEAISVLDESSRPLQLK